MVQRGGGGDRREREERRGEHGGSPESETKPCRGRARLRPTMPVVVDDDGDRVTAAAALSLSRRSIPGRKRRAPRRGAPPHRPPRTKDVEFEKCYSARLSLNDMEGNASPTWVSHVCASAVRARAPRGSFARVYLPKTCSRV